MRPLPRGVSSRSCHHLCRTDRAPGRALGDRLYALWATGCTIQTPLHLDASATVELRIELPDGQGALHIDRARITWSRWTSFTVEFVTLSAEDQGRLEAYLATSQESEWT